MAQSLPIGYLKPPQWLMAPYTSFYKQANKQPILQANSPFLQFLVAPQISKFKAGKMDHFGSYFGSTSPYRVYWGLIGLPTDGAITYL